MFRAGCSLVCPFRHNWDRFESALISFNTNPQDPDLSPQHHPSPTRFHASNPHFGGWVVDSIPRRRDAFATKRALGWHACGKRTRALALQSFEYLH